MNEVNPNTKTLVSIAPESFNGVKTMSEITSNRLINEALEKLNNDGFKKHRRSLELYSGSVIVINLIGANLSQSNPLGVPLKEASRPEMIYYILIAMGLYLLFRYIVAMNTYLKKHIKAYLQNKNQIFFKTKVICKKSAPEGMTNEGRWTDMQRVFGSQEKTYGKFAYFKVRNGSPTNEKLAEYTVENWRRIWPNIKHRFLMHFKDSAIGWDVWMPYYLFALALGSVYYNYYWL